LCPHVGAVLVEGGWWGAEEVWQCTDTVLCRVRKTFAKLCEYRSLLWPS